MYGNLIRNLRRATRPRVVRGSAGRRHGRPGSRSRRWRAAPSSRLLLLAFPGIVALAYALHLLRHDEPFAASPGYLLGIVCFVCALIAFLGDAPRWVRFVASAVNLAGALILL